ncbi:hypothetical protein D3C71_157790 [compost metagenome]
MNSPALKSELLDENQTLQHRTTVFEGGGKWRCETCGFEEPCIIAWKAVDGGPIRMSCHECHLYEDPLRYRDEVALAYLPAIPRAVLSHVIRLTLATSRAPLGEKVAKSAFRDDADPHMKSLAARMLQGVDKAASADHKFSVLKSKLDGAIKEFVKGMGSNIGHGLKFGQTVFPDPEMTLRVLAHGADDDVAELFQGLRLIPKNIRWARADTWNLDLAGGLLAETMAFAKANINPSDPPAEEEPAKSDAAAMDDGERGDAPAATTSGITTAAMGGDE